MTIKEQCGKLFFPDLDNSPLLVPGRTLLSGSVLVSGSKHSILHILGALWLIEGEIKLCNVPDIWDVRHFLTMYYSMGMECSFNGDDLIVKIPSSFEYDQDYLVLAAQLRSSILLLGSLLVRNGHVRFPTPTGDQIGSRPFAEFFTVLEQFNIYYSMGDGYIEASCNNKLQGDRVIDLHTHGNNRTALAIILAAANQGRTILINPLPQPEIIELCSFVDSLICPVRIDHFPDGAIRIMVDGQGRVPIKRNGSFTIGPDKCELGFWIATAGVTSSEIECRVLSPVFSDNHLGPLAGLRQSLLDRLGIHIDVKSPNVFVVEGIRTDPKSVNLEVPHNKELITGLSIDVCPQFIPLMTMASGRSYYRDCKYGGSRVAALVNHLRELGMVVSLQGDTLEIHGENKLRGNNVRGEDIRGAATLLIAVLGAEGISSLDGVYHLNRGYCNIVQKLNHLGAAINRRKD